jgi:holliday junction DNA helicase RuvA
MIASLKGTIQQKNNTSIILDVQGIGYLISIPSTELAKLVIGKEILLNTYLVVKEDALDLYGSSDKKVLDWFKLLLSVKGVGPKSALAIVSLARPQDLSVAIQSNSSDILINLGVGKKSAERIVMELQNKAKDILETDSSTTSTSVAIDTEALQALEALGYSREQAREALKGSKGESVEEKIKSALQMIGK